MKTLSALCLTSLAFALGACSHYSDDLSSLDKKLGTTTTQYVAIAPQEIAPAAGGDVGFNQALAKEYYTLARYENDVAYDYKASKLYTKKAGQAIAEKSVMPSRIESYSIRPKDLAELQSARAELVAALKEQNVYGNGATLAKAQASFDCWLERAEEASKEDHYAECKEAYQSAMAQLVAPAAGRAIGRSGERFNEPIVELPFEYNSALITPQATVAIDKATEFLLSEKGKGYILTITGYIHKDAGNEAVNQLSKSRALMINQAFRQRGVPEVMLKPQLAVASEGALRSNPESLLISVDPELVRTPDLLPTVVHLHFIPPKEPVAVTPASDESDSTIDSTP